MTKLRKFVSLLVVTIMVFSMSINVFADSTASVTITNTTKGDEYSIYKIFDAVVDGNKESYYIDASTDDGAKIKTSAEESDLFTLVAESANKYRVYIDGSESDVRAWVDNVIKANLVSAAKEPVTSDGSDVEFTGLSLGYYYVTTETGALICLKDVNGNITISDKRSAPSWDPSDPKNPTGDSSTYGKYIMDNNPETNTWGKKTEAGINDIQYFMINAYVPKYNGEFPIYDYTIEDTLGDGFTLVEDDPTNNPITATIYSLTDDSYTKVLTVGNGITVDGQKITVNYMVYNEVGYPTDARISITYAAIVDDDAVFYDGSNKNEATLKWTQYDPSKNDGKPTDPTTDPDGTNPPAEPPTTPNPDPDGDPISPFPPPSSTDTYVYEFTLNKVDEDEQPLSGAKFNLYKGTGETKTLVELVKIDEGKYRVATDADSDTTNVIVAGDVIVSGFDIGMYTLVEIEAPVGYNKLANPKEFEIVTEKTADEQNVTVENSKGITLPTTGGIGTRIFYITGATIMLGAIVVLVAKKRTSNNK